MSQNRANERRNSYIRRNIFDNRLSAEKKDMNAIAKEDTKKNQESTFKYPRKNTEYKMINIYRATVKASEIRTINLNDRKNRSRNYTAEVDDENYKEVNKNKQKESSIINIKLNDLETNSIKVSENKSSSGNSGRNSNKVNHIYYESIPSDGIKKINQKFEEKFLLFKTEIINSIKNSQEAIIKSQKETKDDIIKSQKETKDAIIRSQTEIKEAIVKAIQDQKKEKDGYLKKILDSLTLISNSMVLLVRGQNSLKETINTKFK